MIGGGSGKPRIRRVASAARRKNARTGAAGFERVRGPGVPHARLNIRRNLRSHIKKLHNLLIYINNMVGCGAG